MLKDEVEQLKDELTKLKASLAPTPNDEAAMREWQSKMHQVREARMNHASHFSREDLAAFEAAAPTSVVKDIALRDARAPLTYSSPGPASAPTVSNVQQPVGNRTGWQNPIPLSPPPGIDLVDRLLRVDAEREKGERMVQEARRKVVEEKVTDEKTNL